jgi:MFS family permease
MSAEHSHTEADIPSGMTDTGRYLILAAAFLGWMCSGLQMTAMNLVSGAATQEFARSGALNMTATLSWGNLFMLEAPAHPPEGTALEALLQRQQPKWYALYQSGFLFGAAAGGLLFGWVGDRWGRVRAMALSILCYSLFPAVSYFAVTPEQLLLLRFLTALGVGGLWPSGVSLAAEAWSDVSRPMLSGLIGASANFGIVLLGVICYYDAPTAESWRWTLMVCAAPAVLGLFVWNVVPESPVWLAARKQRREKGTSLSASEIFRPPLLKSTLIGIALGTIPLLGGWGVTAWLIRWADKANGAAAPNAKALTSIMRAGGGAIGSLIGGWIANFLGRRVTYFLISLGALGLSEYIFRSLTPLDPRFSFYVFAVGFVSTIYFGWLPLYLPELFPTHARATGAGVSFNFGRILTAFGVLGTGALAAYFHEDYKAAGSLISLVYGLGMIVILFAPDTTAKKLDARDSAA